MSNILPITPDLDPRRAARLLYFTGWRVSSISRNLEIPRATVEAWKQRDCWDNATPVDRVNASFETRICMLVAKAEKDGADYKEIDLLTRQLERTARIEKYNATGKEVDLNPNIAARNAKEKKKPVKNDFTQEQTEKIISAFHESLFNYQKVWFRQGGQRTRNIVKSRQIGATWYFAREALVDALETGRNQIFLSASKKQAHVMRSYICEFARNVADVELSGETIVLPNGAHIYFLSTNANTAQSYHGNFYFDEYFWVPGFKKLNKVASGMAMHKQWRKTYFSTPSAITHEAYPFWSGDHANRGRAKADHLHIDISHKALSRGSLGPDGQWRQLVTVEDAVAGGCNLFDLDELRREYSPDEYDNLLMCQFIDDTTSVFTLSSLQRCMVDSWEEWTDVKPFLPRPYGYKPVWIGYDPALALNGDAASCVVIAPPSAPGGPFRILEKFQWRGSDFQEQAAEIKKMTERYNVAHIAIDATGIGHGVYQLVKQFFPATVAHQYSPELKNRLVLKGLSVVRNGRLLFDAGWTDIAGAFMAIKKSLTPSGRQATYTASYSTDTGHADLAWAILNALDNEPLEGETSANRSFMEIFTDG